MLLVKRPRSSFQGRIFEIQGIAVDNFEFACLKSRAFFLSHCHTDHTQGLYSPEFLDVIASSEINIYMSELSAAIVLNELQSRTIKENIKKHIKVLKLGTTTITLPGILGFEEQYINVTALPAGHCLGSVMFLFKTNESNILYTGDFRIRPSDVKNLHHLHDNNGDPIKLDVIYVDTTFIDKKYAEFPKRDHCFDELSDIITNWLAADPNNRVAFNLSAKFGYEFLLEEISKRLNTKIFINDNRLDVYKQSPRLHGVFTNAQMESKLHVCKMFPKPQTHDQCGVISIEKGTLHYLCIRLSALKWSQYDLESSAIVRDSETGISVCFPTHCSRSELIYFVNYLSPMKIIGFPNEYKEELDSSIDYPIPSKRGNFKFPTKTNRQMKSPVDYGRDNDKKMDKKMALKIFSPIF